MWRQGCSSAGICIRSGALLSDHLTVFGFSLILVYSIASFFLVFFFPLCRLAHWSWCSFLIFKSIHFETFVCADCLSGINLTNRTDCIVGSLSFAQEDISSELLKDVENVLSSNKVDNLLTWLWGCRQCQHLIVVLQPLRSGAAAAVKWAEVKTTLKRSNELVCMLCSL